MKDKIRNRIYNFFTESYDFNGIPLRQISDEFDIGYKESIDLIKELVEEKTVSIQSSTNPHIIGFQHFPIKSQLKVLEQAKDTTVTVEKMGEISIQYENTDYPICLYPSQTYLKANRNLDDFENAEYSKQLALGEPHRKPVFFEIEVLERYLNDPRFEFSFEDYSGHIYCKHDENEEPILRKEDPIFLKTLGLRFDSENNRLAVVYLRYLKDLTSEHQIYWKSKEVDGNCKILEEYYQNTIKGNWTNSYSIFSGFLGELKCLNELTEFIFDKPIFRNNFDGEKRPSEFTYFFTPTLKNYNDFVLLLDKMISENIDKKFFKGKVELFEEIKIEDGKIERRNKGTLRLFEEWLTSQFNTNNDRELKKIFKLFKKVRRKRQKPAHRINENEYNKKYIDLQKEIMGKSYESMRALRNIFQQHPKAKIFNIPEWLENGEIKAF